MKALYLVRALVAWSLRFRRLRDPEQDQCSQQRRAASREEPFDGRCDEPFAGRCRPDGAGFPRNVVGRRELSRCGQSRAQRLVPATVRVLSGLLIVSGALLAWAPRTPNASALVVSSPSTPLPPAPLLQSETRSALVRLDGRQDIEHQRPDSDSATPSGRDRAGGAAASNQKGSRTDARGTRTSEAASELERDGVTCKDKDGVTYKDIESIRVGDRVLARDPATGETVRKRVERVFCRRSDHLRLLDIRDHQGQRQTLQTTDEHPFWVPERGWVPAARLGRGAVLQGLQGWGVVLETRREERPEGVSVYNFETRGLHTYFVAADAAPQPMLVHNCNPEDVAKLYHYTHADPALIRQGGLRIGSGGGVFLTPNPHMSPLQALTDLALPPNRGLPVHLIEVDVPTLLKYQIPVPAPRQVGRGFNMPGGGVELIVPSDLPASAVRVLR